MAISIDRVYQKVLAFANKEQRGYITPQEFNLFAHQAQMEIFEQYFYDINQWTRQPGNNHDFADMQNNLEEKISLFEHSAVTDNVTVKNKYGDVNIGNDLPNLYRLGSVRIKYPQNTRYVEAEKLNNMKEFRLLGDSKLTYHNIKRPVYLRYFYGYDRIKIYPYPVDDDGSSFDLSTQEFSNDYIEVQSVEHEGSWSPADGVYFYFDQQEMIDMLGDGFTSGDFINISTTNSTGNTNKLNNRKVKLWTSESQYAVDGYAHGRLEPYNGTAEFTDGDRIFLSTPKELSNKRNVRVDYIRKPASPNWNYVVVGDKALYSSTVSVDFELHASEESELVYRILAYAGVSMQKPQLTQTAAALEPAKVQQEKQYINGITRRQLRTSKLLCTKRLW